MAKFRIDFETPWRFHPALFVFISIAFIIIVYLSSIFGFVSYPFGSKSAICGAFMACCGVLTVARPFIRVGGFKKWYDRLKVIDLGHFVPTPEEIEEDKQLKKDTISVQIFGPALIIVGTMMNGLSGFIG